MMQVSTLYAQSLERQLVSRRTQIIQNISRTCALDQQNINNPQVDALSSNTDEMVLSEAGIIPPELQDDHCFTNINNNVCSPLPETKPIDIDPKEFTDRLCKLPSQCKGGYILGSPRRHSLSHSSNNLCVSAGSINLSSTPLIKPQNVKKATADKKDKKEAKKLPSNFMHLGSWSTRLNFEKLLEQIQTGDVLEFNIKFHHHWGIALIPKNKKTTLQTVEIVHLFREKDSTQRTVKQTLSDYWTQGVTARINNSRDVHKPPNSSTDVASTALKLISQPYRIWQNSEQMINFCRYGEGVRSRQMSDAARWSTINKCVGLWLSLTSTRSSPDGSPSSTRRKRTGSVSF